MILLNVHYLSALLSTYYPRFWNTRYCLIEIGGYRSLGLNVVRACDLRSETPFLSSFIIEKVASALTADRFFELVVHADVWNPRGSSRRAG